MIPKKCPICDTQLLCHKGTVDYNFFYCPNIIKLFSIEKYHYTFCYRTYFEDSIEYVYFPPYRLINDFSNDSWNIDEYKEAPITPSYNEIMGGSGSIEINDRLSIDRIKRLMAFL